MEHTHCLSAFSLSVQDNLHNRKRKAATSPRVMNTANGSTETKDRFN